MYKILIIEDRPEIRENLVEYLELSGYKTIEANCGLDGIKMAVNHQPDLILCDVVMPGMNGFEVLSNISNNLRTQKIPFIFISSISEKDSYLEAMQHGADDFLVKPFELEELLFAIEKWLKTGSLRRFEKSF
jgi:CheY-like chemotaxis protein